MKTKDMPHGVVGLRFAKALLNRDFEEAHNMLAPELKIEYSADQLKDRFERMMRLASRVDAPDDVEAMDNGELGDSSFDAEGWVYVAIWTEGVSVTVKTFLSEYLITDIVWGRP